MLPSLRKIARWTGRGVPLFLLGRLLRAAAESTGRLVLVVDDDILVCESIVEMLDLEGIKGVPVQSGTAAVAALQERPGAFGLVLLDLSMPGMDGMETLEALQRIRPQIPVVLVSGYERNVALQRFQSHGLAGFLQKPFDYLTFVGLLKSVF